MEKIMYGNSSSDSHMSIEFDLISDWIWWFYCNKGQWSKLSDIYSVNWYRAAWNDASKKKKRKGKFAFFSVHSSIDRSYFHQIVAAYNQLNCNKIAPTKFVSINWKPAKKKKIRIGYLLLYFNSLTVPNLDCLMFLES